MAESTELPSQPDERHFEIAQRAADMLAARLDGNGLKAEQVRLGRHEDLVHELPGQLTIGLKPDIATAQLKGKTPRGEVLRNKDEVGARAEGDIDGHIADVNVQGELIDELKRDPGQGFGKPPYRQALNAAKNEFCTVDQCPRCHGETTLACTNCSATGNTPCPQCNAVGLVQCPGCFGTGQQDKPDGTRGPCMRCNGRLQIQCPTCQGLRELRCPTCGGTGHVNCADCGRSGYWTYLYQLSYHAEGQFELERQFIPQEIQEVVDKLGVRQIATDGHAEIFRMSPELREHKIIFPYVAVLPTARVEFHVAGKTVPATVAGLHARLLEIEPIMDKIIKPGINALFKLSKGPMASEALIDTACKYKVIRHALGGLMGHSKRQVYQQITKEYPAILSEKYAKAVVKYAEVALLAIAAAPRRRGLMVGTALSVIISAAYYMSPVRGLIVQALTNADKTKFMPAIDGAIWLLGFIAAFMTIKIMAARALKELLPDNVKGAKDKGLPPAGPLGMWALPITAVGWLAAAFFANPRPDWLLQILSHLHR